MYMPLGIRRDEDVRDGRVILSLSPQDMHTRLIIHHARLYCLHAVYSKNVFISLCDCQTFSDTMGEYMLCVQVLGMNGCCHGR